jgi:hypothetical protein
MSYTETRSAETRRQQGSMGQFLYRQSKSPGREFLFALPGSRSFLQSGQPVFKDSEPSLKLFIGHHKGHQQPNDIAVTAAREQQQPFVTASANQGLGLVGGRSF